ncbi:MAG: type III-B CRISPR module-associated protein Cmr5 [Candidatus Methylumidiphilus sp.]
MPLNFKAAMDKFFKAESSFYMQATDETLALLRWIRQFAAAQS